MDEQNIVNEALETETQNPDGKTRVDACGVFGLSLDGFGDGVSGIGESGQGRDRVGVGVEWGSGGRGNVSLASDCSGLGGGSGRDEEVCLVGGRGGDVVDGMEAVRGENVGACVDDVREFGQVGLKEKCHMPSEEVEGEREEMVYVDKVLEESEIQRQPELHRADLGKETDIPRDGISLYVEISCEANCTNNGIQEMLCSDEMGTNECRIDNSECSFSVGDIVWVKTKNQSWWPGKVRDCRDVSICDTKPNHRSSLLVSYFGSAHAAWCNLSQVKPFHDNFELISRQNNSKSFVAAVRKAVHEYGRNVKMDMTCSCFLKGRQLPDTGCTADVMLPAPERTLGRLDFLVNQLGPIRFLENVRSLALISLKTGMLNITITQNYLAAFYQFRGYRQLPVNQLQDQLGLDKKCEASEDAASNRRDLSSELDSKLKKIKCTKIFQGENSLKKSRSSLATTSEKRTGLMESKISESKSIGPREKNTSSKGELRERKKSKYLSYPYVNLDKSSHNKTEETETPKSQGGENTCTGQLPGSPSADHSFSSNRFQSKWANKFMKSCTPELLKASSAEMLDQLKYAAVNTLYPKECINFDSMKWFYLKFRISVYNDKSINEASVKSMIGENEAMLFESPNILPTRSIPESEKVTSERAEASSLPNESGDAGELPGNFSEDLLKLIDNAPTIDHKMKIEQEEEEQMRLKTKSIYGLSGSNMITKGLFWREMSSVTAPGKPERKRRKKKGETKFTQMSTTQVTAIPDLNGDNSIDSGAVGDKNRNHAGPSFFSVDLQLNCTTALEANQEKNAGSEFTTRVPNCSGESSLLVDVQAVTGTLTPELMHKRKRRNKKGKAASDSSKTCLVSSIPDLNGTSTESASPGKKLPEINLVSPEGKTEQKKRRRRQVTTVKGQKNLWTQNMLHNNDLGTSLLLKFAPGTVMPPREILESTFSRFGPLKESETKLSKDSDIIEVSFLKTGDALEAFRSLEKCNPFGATLVNYRLHQHSAASMAFGPDKISKRSRACLPIGGFLAHVNPSTPKPASTEAPPPNVMKQNLEMMTSMLEKSGSTLSPEIRNNLEREIKGLLEKVSGMSGPSS